MDYSEVIKVRDDFLVYDHDKLFATILEFLHHRARGFLTHWCVMCGAIRLESHKHNVDNKHERDYRHKATGICPICGKTYLHYHANEDYSG